MGAGTASKKASRLITIGGPVGLLFGIALGALAHSGNADWAASLLPWVEPIGRLWMNALRVVVVPLTVCLLVLGVCSIPQGRTLGRWASLTFAWIVGLLLLGALFSIIASEAYFAVNAPAPIELALGAEVPDPDESEGDWVEGLLPGNLFAAAANGDILPLAILAALFGLALRAVPDERRRPVESFFLGIRDAVLVFVHWVLLAIPLGAFALAFSFVSESGLGAAGTLVHFTVYVSALLILFAIPLVVVTVVASRRGTARMLAVMSPLVAVAVGTRSSLASLPSLVESANEVELPVGASEIVLPTCVSLFKLNRAISSTAKLLFIAATIGFTIAPQAMVVFVGTIVLLSFATPGLPAGGSNATWGAYMAAGLPIEAIVLFEVTDPITDIFKTVLNVLADFAVAVFVSRGAAP